MGTSEDVISGINSLVMEAYSGMATPPRMAEIQAKLKEFSERPDAWQYSIILIRGSNHLEITMFAFVVLNGVARSKWCSMCGEDKQMIRSCLEDFLNGRVESLHQFGHEANYCLLVKCAKVLSTVARFDWPHFYPSFMDTIFALIQCHDSRVSTTGYSKCSTGLLALKISSEELLRTDDNFSVVRGAELREGLTKLAPTVLQVMTDCADRVLGRPIVQAFLTYLQQPGFDANRFATLLFSLVDPLTTLLLHSVEQPKSEPEILRLLVNFVDCMSELYTWLPMNTPNLDSLYASIYAISLLGSPTFVWAVAGRLNQFGLSVSKIAQQTVRLGVGFVNCLQEIVSRKDLSASSMTSHLWPVFHMLAGHLHLASSEFTLPQEFVAKIDSALGTSVEVKTHQVAPGIDCSVVKEYHRKIIEVLSQLATNLIGLTEDRFPSQFSAAEFLHLMIRFTFKACKVDLETYCEMLKTWQLHFEYIRISCIGDALQENVAALIAKKVPHRSLQLADELGAALVSSLLFAESAVHLDTLNDDVGEEIDDPLANEQACTAALDFTVDSVSSDEVDPGDLCDFRQFVHQSMLLLDAIVMLSPVKTLKALVVIFSHNSETYQSVLAHHQLANAGLSSHDASKLHWSLRDLAFATQALGFLVEHLTVQCVQEVGANIVAWLVETLLKITDLSVSSLPTVLGHAVPQLRRDFVEVFAQALYTLHSLIGSGYLRAAEPQVESAIVPLNVLSLREEQARSFTNSCLRLVSQLILSEDGIVVPQRLQQGGIRLLQRLFCSSPAPGLRPSAEWLLRAGESGDAGPAIVRGLVELACSCERLARLHIASQRLLMRALTAYLLSAEQKLDKLNAPIESVKVQAFKHLLDCRFQAQLTVDELAHRTDAHRVTLVLFTECLVAIENLNSSRRDVAFNLLCNSGLLDKLLECTKTLIANNRPGQGELFLAYLAFLTTFTRVYSYSSSAMALMPQMIGQILAAIQQSSDTLKKEQVLQGVVNILLVVVQNREVLLKICTHVLELATGRLLSSLAETSELTFDGSEAVSDELVCRAARLNPETCERLFRLLLSTLTNGFVTFFVVPVSSSQGAVEVRDEKAFTALMALFLAVLHPEQSDARLVTLLIEGLEQAQCMRRLLDVPAFSERWRPLFAKKMLDLLINRVSPACHDALFRFLFVLLVETGQQPNVPETHFFTNEFLPAYLKQTGLRLDDNQRQRLIDICLDNEADSSSSASNSPVSPYSVGLADRQVFQARIKNLVNEIGFYQSLT